MKTRNQQIYAMAVNGYKYKEISREFGISLGRISQIVNTEKSKSKKNLPKKERDELMRKEFSGGKSYKQLAKEFDISQGRVWQIINYWEKPTKKKMDFFVGGEHREDFQVFLNDYKTKVQRKPQPINNSPFILLGGVALVVALVALNWLFGLI